ILYDHAAQADPLIRDVVVEWLVPLPGGGISSIDVSEVRRLLAGWVAEGKSRGAWSEPTTRRIAQGFLATLRDFGVLQGAVRKRLAPAYIAVTAFAYVMFTLKQHHPSGS